MFSLPVYAHFVKITAIILSGLICLAVDSNEWCHNMYIVTATLFIVLAVPN